MQRYLFQSVSQQLLAILVRAESHLERDGFAWVSNPDKPGAAGDFCNVRKVNKPLLTELKKRLPKKEWFFVAATRLLRDAERRNDSRAAKRALAILQEHLFKNPAPRRVTMLADRIGRGDLMAKLSDPLVSRALSRVRLVPWLESDPAKKEQRRGIGLYCPDDATAIAANFLLGDLRICPRCEKPFTADAPNQYCCSIKCREAHRLARWRDKNKKRRQK